MVYIVYVHLYQCKYHMDDIQRITSLTISELYTTMIKVSSTAFGISASVYEWDFSELYFQGSQYILGVQNRWRIEMFQFLCYVKPLQIMQYSFLICAKIYLEIH